MFILANTLHRKKKNIVVSGPRDQKNCDLEVIQTVLPTHITKQKLYLCIFYPISSLCCTCTFSSVETKGISLQWL
jgi:hypothetical protein